MKGGQMADFWIKEGETMLFIGDSITDCGRRGEQAPLGNGYVSLFTELATARFPERKIRYINKGIGGNRTSDLQERWRDDVLFHQPDRFSVKIGINDLHSHLRGAEDGIGPELFAENYDELLDLTESELNCPVVLISPFFISTDRSGQTFRSRVLDLLPHYIEVVEKMSVKYNTKLVRLQDIFAEHLKHRDADTFCPEPVHPNHTGHLVIAQALMDVLTK
jgi:lysophospholipase L1-like esterase